MLFEQTQKLKEFTFSCIKSGIRTPCAFIFRLYSFMPNNFGKSSLLPVKREVIIYMEFRKVEVYSVKNIHNIDSIRKFSWTAVV